MGNEMQDQGIKNELTFVLGSATERVITIFQLWGCTPQQIESMTGRHSEFGSRLNNLHTFRHEPQLQEKCLCNKGRLEAELVRHRPVSPTQDWTDLQVLDMVLMVAKAPIVPPKLQEAFEGLQLGDPEPEAA